MTGDEHSVWAVITDGLAQNAPIPPMEVLYLAIAVGQTLGVPKPRVIEIFDAVQAGVPLGTWPL